MAPERDEEERERPSWREIDQKRDRPGAFKAEKRPRQPQKQAELVRQQALKQAEALFKGKRARPEYRAALRQLEGFHGTKKFMAGAKKFLAEYGLPEEWGVLNLLLDYSDPGVVEEVLKVMGAQAASHSRVEQQGFKGKVRILALTSPHSGLRAAAQELLGIL
jgi:hypothetical protein